MSPTPTYKEEPPKSGLMTALVAGAIIALVAANIYLYVQVDHVRSDVHDQMTKMHDSIMAEVASLRDSSSVTTASTQKHIDTLKEELETARNQARTMSSQAKAEAEARAEQLAKQLQVEQAKATQQVRTELSGVKQTADTANAKLADVSTDVGNVKTDLTSTKSELQKTIADLKSVRGDLGVQSGLVATNGSELAALKRLGERNYFEFKLGKSKQFQRVGDVTLKLRDADPKKNQYSVDVMADDKLTEKKNKNLNEPVQFYTAKGGHIPYELVVNQVQKNLIVGYLSTPKETTSR